MIYRRIFNGFHESMRGIKYTNKCWKCGHDIMLTNDDYKPIITHMSTHHVQHYYHATECHVCGQKCGLPLMGESKIKEFEDNKVLEQFITVQRKTNIDIMFVTPNQNVINKRLNQKIISALSQID